MKTAMRLFGVFVPVFLAFGPIFMVISSAAESQTTMSTLYGFIGALGLAFGSLYLFRMIHSLKNELEELKKRVGDTAAA